MREYSSIYWCRLAIVIALMIPSCSQTDELNGQDSSIELSGPYLGQEPPGAEPQLFVPESLRTNNEWWWHRGVIFPTDGTEMYSDIYVGTDNEGITIRYQEIVDGYWTAPQRTHVDGAYAEASPAFLDNGNTMYFMSDRPGGSNYRVWKTSRTDGTWSEPAAVSINPGTDLGGGWEISIAADETLYLRMSDNSMSTDLDIFICEKSGEGYSTPVRMSNNINSDAMDLAPFVAPDESYLIFASARAGGYGGVDLYISFGDGEGEWTPAINMGSAINTSANEGAPTVSADGLYLFFLSDLAPYGRNPYWVDASIIESLNPLSTDKHGSPAHTSEEFGLAGCYPNPFNPSTTIQFDMPMATDIQIVVHDLAGREVVGLINQHLEPGFHEQIWNGRDRIGRVVPSGIYIARLLTPAYTSSVKMLLLK